MGVVIDMTRSLYKPSDIYYNPESKKYIFRLYIAEKTDDKIKIYTKDLEYNIDDDALFFILSRNTLDIFKERNKKGKAWKSFLKGNTNKKLLSLI